METQFMRNRFHGCIYAIAIVLSIGVSTLSSEYILNDLFFKSSDEVKEENESFNIRNDKRLSDDDINEIIMERQRAREEAERIRIENERREAEEKRKAEEQARIEAAVKSHDLTSIYLSDKDISNLPKTKLNKDAGTVQFNGHQETYYSEKILPGTNLWLPGRHTTDDGLIRDKNGYICLAINNEWMIEHGITRGEYYIETSLGMGCVYDTGCAMGVVDLYTSW